MTNKRPLIIAYQGIEGSNSFSACQKWYPQHQAVGYINFEEAIRSVEQNTADLAMIPIENSQGGRVAEIHQILFHLDVSIVAEHFLPIAYVLCGIPSSEIEDLKTVTSHTQALAQCHNNIRALGLETRSHADTAGAARDVAHLGEKSAGAVASQEAAEFYGLKILRNRFEDNLHNVTRFITIAPQKRQTRSDRSCLTSIVFETRSIPAALYKCLGGFATNGINMVKLESHITIGKADSASFYVEIEGHEEEKAVQRALSELHLFSRSVRLLGSYEASPFRAKS